MIDSKLGQANIHYNPEFVDESDITQNFQFIEDVDELYHQYVSQKSRKGGDYDYDGGQNQHELYAFWGILSSLIKKSNRSYFKFLEVGGSMGLWPVILDVVSNNLNVQFDYTTVTWINHNSVANKNLYRVREYYRSKNKVFNLINADSTSQFAIDESAKYGPMYDFVFIGPYL